MRLPVALLSSLSLALGACSLLSDVDGQGYSGGAGQGGVSGSSGQAGASGSAGQPGKAGAGGAGKGGGGAAGAAGQAGAAGKPATPSICGNGILEGDEECDGDSLLCQQCKAVCPPNTLRRLEPGVGYRCYGATVEALSTWQNARTACRAAPGCDLASLSTSEELDEVATFFSSVAQSSVLWLSGQTNRFAWGAMPAFFWGDLALWTFGPSASSLYPLLGDDSPVVPSGASWQDAPSPQDGLERCVALADGSPRRLISVDCGAKRLPLCECAIPGRPCNRDGVVDPGEECDDGNSTDGDGCSARCEVECAASGLGQVAFKDPSSHRCFLFLPSDNTRASAEAACVAQGMHLARITSVADLALATGGLLAQAPGLLGDVGGIWVDGSDEASEGTWSLWDGSSLPLGQSPWTKNQPDGGLKANCVALDAQALNNFQVYALNDLLCTQTKPALCERVPAGKP